MDLKNRILLVASVVLALAPEAWARRWDWGDPHKVDATLAHAGKIGDKVKRFSIGAAHNHGSTVTAAKDALNMYGHWASRSRTVSHLDAQGKPTQSTVTRYTNGGRSVTLAEDSLGGATLRVREANHGSYGNMVKSSSVDGSGTTYSSFHKQHLRAGGPMSDGTVFPGWAKHNSHRESMNGRGGSTGHVETAETYGGRPTSSSIRLNFTAKPGEHAEYHP